MIWLQLLLFDKRRAARDGLDDRERREGEGERGRLG